MERQGRGMAGGAHWILTRPSHDTTGSLFIDEDVACMAGVTDPDRYAVVPCNTDFMQDCFLD